MALGRGPYVPFRETLRSPVEAPDSHSQATSCRHLFSVSEQCCPQTPNPPNPRRALRASYPPLGPLWQLCGADDRALGERVPRQRPVGQGLPQDCPFIVRSVTGLARSLVAVGCVLVPRGVRSVAVVAENRLAGHRRFQSRGAVARRRGGCQEGRIGFETVVVLAQDIQRFTNCAAVAVALVTRAPAGDISSLNLAIGPPLMGSRPASRLPTFQRASIPDISAYRRSVKSILSESFRPAVGMGSPTRTTTRPLRI